MRSILVICGMLGSPDSANGICAKNIIEELLERKCIVSVITDGDAVPESIKRKAQIYYIKTSWFRRYLQKNIKNPSRIRRLVFHLVHLIRNVFSLFVYPDVSPLRSWRVYKKAMEIITNDHTDIILGLYRPYESITASLRIKRKMRENIIVKTYHLDLLSSPENQSMLIRSYKKLRGKRAFNNELRLCDEVLLPQSAKQLDIDSEKVTYLDFPLFVKNPDYTVRTIARFSETTINISYIGTLDNENRNPGYIISLLEQLPIIHDKQVILHIWGKLCDIAVEKIVKQSNNVHFHGLISNDQVMCILHNSDFLLNISNKITYRMIPSKIFQLFAANKPIINIVQHNNDAALPYFLKSNCSLCLMTDQDENLSKLITFLTNNYNVKVYNPRETYKESTPEYAVNLVLR